MKVEQHDRPYNEDLKKIETAIEEGVEENQRNVAFNISQGSVELFAIYLHKLNLIQEGLKNLWEVILIWV